MEMHKDQKNESNQP